MKKLLIVFVSIGLLAQACTPFGATSVNVGIIKTANGGVDWQDANIIKDSDQKKLVRSISKLKFNPSGDQVFASAYDGGLYKSGDAAESWEEVLGQIQLYDFDFDPDFENIIYAAGYFDDRGRLFKTEDGGDSWNDVYTDAGESNPARAVAVNPNDPETILIGLGKGTVLISENSGDSWRLIEDFNGRVNQIVWQGSTVYVVVKEKGVFKSLDEGETFEKITDNLEPRNNSLGFSLFGTRVSDFRQLAASEDDQGIYLTTNNGLYQSDNGGDKWSYVSMPYRQRDAAPHGVAIAPSNGFIVYVSSGSVVFKTTDGGFAWGVGDTMTNGLITTILVSPQLPSLTFAGVSQ